MGGRPFSPAMVLAPRGGSLVHILAVGGAHGRIARPPFLVVPGGRCTQIDNVSFKLIGHELPSRGIGPFASPSEPLSNKLKKALKG
jgi:hypothetical protein